MKIKLLTPIYTGGGIYVLLGELDDGNYFMADTCEFDVRIVNADPRKDYDECFYPEWQEARLVKDLCPTDALLFLKDAIEWTRRHEPYGNYDIRELELFILDIEECLNSGKEWR